MKKTLVTGLILIVVGLIGTKAFIALFAYQVFEKFKSELAQDAALTYSWLSSDFDGVLTVHGLSVRSFDLKRSFEVDELRLSYPHYFGLLLGLPGLKQAQWDQLERIQVLGLKAELNGRDPEEWLAMYIDPRIATPLALYGCGDHRRVSHDVLREMGLEALRMDLDMAFVRDRAGTVTSSAGIDLKELGRIDFYASWAEDGISSTFGDMQWEALKLKSAQIRHVEGGYFRRLSNFCSPRVARDRQGFAEEAARQWQAAMYDIGLEPGPELVNVYRDYLHLGGALTLDFQPDSAFHIGSEAAYLDRNLAAALGVNVLLNEKEINSPFLLVRGSKFKPLPPPLPEAQERQTQVETEVFEIPGFREKSVEAIATFVGQKVRLTLAGGKQVEGRVQIANDSLIEITQWVQGGQVSFRYKLDTVDSLEVWQ